MKSINLITAIFMTFVLAGCEKILEQPKATLPQAPIETEEPKSNFQIVSSKEGKLYRLNNTSGEMYLVTDTGLLELTKDVPILHVGKYYQMEDSDNKTEYLKYLGDGKFERSRYAALWEGN